MRDGTSNPKERGLAVMTMRPPSWVARTKRHRSQTSYPLIPTATELTSPNPKSCFVRPIRPFPRRRRLELVIEPKFPGWGSDRLDAGGSGV